jgi:2-amino-4-hydroxy-6-hydroxymethyldihydropteridine diphosphokinase
LPQTDQIVLTGLKVSCIIGIFDWERKQKQDVVIDMKLPVNIQKAARQDRIEAALDYKRIAKATIAFVEKSRYQLIETLSERLAEYLISQFKLPEISLRISKPGAIRGSQNVGIEITRKGPTSPEGLVYFSLGSNIDAELHLKNALKELDAKFGLKIISHIYETSPVGGGKNQPFFWNMVVGVDTDEKPEMIRKWIGRLEKKEGRARTKNRYGSRTLDVDLILWKDAVLKGKSFSLPHSDIETKAFVLFPLLEIAPQLALPNSGRSLIELAHSFKDKGQSIHRLKKPSSIHF